MARRSGMDPTMSAVLMSKVLGRRATESSSGETGSFEHCIIASVTTADDITSITFTRPMYDDNATKYGPVQFNLSGTPEAGDNVLIAWVEGPSNHNLIAWVLGWSV
jgi:hypothetical protein